VHLWRFRLDLPPLEITELLQTLSADEQLRADRLLHRTKAENFVVARGRLRQILARYLNQQPKELTFAYNEQGKPSLAGNPGNKISFNLAHAGQWGVLAVTSGTEIGVDIEQIDPDLDYENIAAGFFSTTEIDRLNQYLPHRRRRVFYRIWTCKEAGLKAVGGGFSTPAIGGEEKEWHIRQFSVAQNYLGAVAVSGEGTVTERWDFGERFV
jgi:4'-phosphopantetheinyl transferase